MNVKKHPLVGLFVSGYLFGQNAVAKVDAVKMTGRGKNKVMAGLIVRPHSMSGVDLPKGMSTWDRAQRMYMGNKKLVDLRLVKSVWPGPDEGWVDFKDFLDWCESNGTIR